MFILNNKTNSRNHNNNNNYKNNVSSNNNENSKKEYSICTNNNNNYSGKSILHHDQGQQKLSLSNCRHHHYHHQAIDKQNNNIRYKNNSTNYQLSIGKTKFTIAITKIYTVLMLFILFSIAPAPTPAHADWLLDCGDCHCKWNSGKKTADCKNLSLRAIPENLSSEVQVLDLSYNRIPFIEKNVFQVAHLQNLHKLFIRNSSIEKIVADSFVDLQILIELDLSNNLLRSINDNVFRQLCKVRALILNGNLLETLKNNTFNDLRFLHKIELKHNRLKHIEINAFLNLPLLSQVYLDDNRLTFLRRETFDTVVRLTALSLEQNPWNCTCELQIFRDFVLKRNLYTPPTSCHYPLHLRNMLWIDDQPEAFACKPKIIYPARGASINTSKENVTLICRVKASANTVIVWDYNKQIYRATTSSSSSSSSSSAGGNHHDTSSRTGGLLMPSSSTALQHHGGTHHSQRVHIQLLRDVEATEKEFGREVFISRLNIIGAEKSDEGIYTCIAENGAGKDVVQMTLLIQKPGARDFLLQGNLIVVIGLMALGLLSVSVFLAMVTCCIYKRFKSINPGHHRHLHHINMSTADQLTSTGDHTTGAMTTNVVMAGGTDVILASDDDNSLSRYKQHKTMTMTKTKTLTTTTTNLNGGTRSNSKYADVIKQHQVGVGAVQDNGLIVGYVTGPGVTTNDSATDALHHHHHQQQQHQNQHHRRTGDADKSYLERNNEDTLNLKYPHVVAQGNELSYAAIAHPTSSSATTTPTTAAAVTPTSSTGGRSTGSGNDSITRPDERKHHIGYMSPSPGSNKTATTSEYQPDLLPAYSSTLKSGSGKATTKQTTQSPYSPIKTMRTLNAKDQHATAAMSMSAASASRSKYNINVQEYLHAKYGTIGDAIKTSANSRNTASNAITQEKSNKREAPSIPLTSSASLSAAFAAAAAAAVAATGSSSPPPQESGFSTLQRHCKSLAMPSTGRSSGSSTHTPTDNSNSNSCTSSGYEYRQPPPPPYNATHRTSSASVVSGLLTIQRRTTATSDLQVGDSTGGVGGLGGLGVGVDLTTGTTLTQTIVTASPSLNFLTTTGSYTPRRQLL